MTKDIKQIQEENRKLIIKACNPEFDPERFDYLAYQVTLSKVLLTLGKIDCGSFFISNESVSFITAGDDYGKTHSFEWNLKEEILENQRLEVQIAINQLLTKC